jgi:hypothetical protein
MQPAHFRELILRNVKLLAERSEILAYAGVKSWR